MGAVKNSRVLRAHVNVPEPPGKLATMNNNNNNKGVSLRVTKLFKNHELLTTKISLLACEGQSRNLNTVKFGS